MAECRILIRRFLPKYLINGLLLALTPLPRFDFFLSIPRVPSPEAPSHGAKLLSHYRGKTKFLTSKILKNVRTIGALRALYFVLIQYFLLCSPCHLQAETSSEEQISKRINAHLVIGDLPSACDEARFGISQYPHSKLLGKEYIRALARTGDEKAMMAQWRLFIEAFPEEATNHEVLEILAWAVIDKGWGSSSPVIRVTALLGAFFSQDAKGVAILRQGMLDPNSLIRGAAVKLSSHLRDATLQDQLIVLLKSEPVWKVKLETIQAVGKLQYAEARPELEFLIGHDNAHIAEKAAAIEALVMISDGIDSEKIKLLVQSDRVGMRLLACELILHFDQKQDIDWLFPLLQDHHASLRAKIFQVIGCMRASTVAEHPVIELAKQGVNDPDPLVANTAAWVLMLNDQEEGNRAFETLLKNEVRENRYLAASALASTGKYGLPLTQKIFKTEADPYIKMNLALELIGQRVDVIHACNALFKGLSQQKERWDWKHEGQFRILAPSKVKHDDTVPNQPEAVNQLTRLEVLEILAVLQYPHAQKAIKQFLQESNWGVTGLASALLLTEGDDKAADLVNALIKDPDEKVRIQAALILALWGRGEDAVQLLQEAYPTADRELKGKILEGIGRVGSPSSLRFLSERLQEPYQTLRIIAAAALLECLYK